VEVILHVTEGPERGRTFRFFEADSFLIGRGEETHLTLDPEADRYISRSHCLLEVRPPRCILIDLGSTNGTFVKGEKIGQVELSDGETFRVGRTEIRVEIKGGLAVAPSGLKVCLACGKLLPAREGASGAAEEPGANYCVDCRNLAENNRPRRPIPPAAAALPRKKPLPHCISCSAEVPEGVHSRGPSTDAEEQLFLCRTCIQKETSNQSPPVQLDRYVILAELGRGGMGVVYKGVEKESGRLCAVKSILPHVARDERARRRFEREIEIQASVEHPNLVRVRDRARDNRQTLYFITEYLPGGDLGKAVSRVCKGPLDPPTACRLMIQILRGLQKLHENGMIHRDLKPSNFLLSRPYNDPRCLAKISDYGFAKCFEAAGNSLFEYTSDGVIAGSPMYMPPEQITQFRFVRPPSDVYSAGASLYYMLSARFMMNFPTPKDRLEEIKQGIRPRHPLEILLSDAPIPLLERKPDLPPRLAAVVEKAVRRDVNERFQTAEEFRHSLDQAMTALGWGI
jgi:hypothetical protein